MYDASLVHFQNFEMPRPIRTARTLKWLRQFLQIDSIAAERALLLFVTGVFHHPQSWCFKKPMMMSLLGLTSLKYCSNVAIALEVTEFSRCMLVIAVPLKSIKSLTSPYFAIISPFRCLNSTCPEDGMFSMTVAGPVQPEVSCFRSLCKILSADLVGSLEILLVESYVTSVPC